MTRHVAVTATAEAFELAESPVWDAVRGSLLWVDIDAGLLLHGDIAGDEILVRQRREFDGAVTAVAVAADGGALVAVGRGVVELLPDGTPGREIEIVPAGVASRLNDGACDPAGRFIVGTKALDGRAGTERLVLLDRTGVTTLDDDLTLSNGIAWSPDGRTMYSVDSIPGVIWSRTGTGERRELLRIGDGTPDGLCVDDTGGLWVAIWGRGEVRRYEPGGRVTDVVEVDAPHTSSVAFAGPGLDTLVVTTARADLDPAALAAAPRSGHLFLARTGARGVPVTPWDPRTLPDQPAPTPTLTPTGEPT